MINIRETVKTPSAALQYMLDGLIKQSQRYGFEIDMATFGDTENGICYGCAATCAIQEIANKELTCATIGGIGKRAVALGFDERELSAFESAIDDARNRNFRALFSFFNVSHENRCRYQVMMPRLYSATWDEDIPEVESLISKLKEDGL